MDTAAKRELVAKVVQHFGDVGPTALPKNEGDALGDFGDQSQRVSDTLAVLEEMRRRMATHYARTAALLGMDLSPKTNVQLGAAVIYRDGEETLCGFMVPKGCPIPIPDDEIILFSPESPVGKGFLGKGAGETVEVRTAGGSRTLEIIAVG